MIDEERKSRGEYLPTDHELSEFYFHGTKHPFKKHIERDGIKEENLKRGYYGWGLYASRSKDYAQRYGNALVKMKPIDGVDIVEVNEPSKTHSIPSLDCDIVEVYDGIEVIIKNPDSIEVIRDE